MQGRLTVVLFGCVLSIKIDTRSFTKMKFGNLLCVVSTLFVTVSCFEQYSIVGNTSVPMFDGKMLYLKARSGDNVKNIDSCEVIHGKFGFDGKMDSTVMAELFLGNVCVMPVVIEKGNISVDINVLDQKVYGGSLNERLYNFLEAKSRLDNERRNMALKQTRLMMKGFMPFESQRICEERSEQISKESDSIEIEFIKSNYNNVLGPEVFSLICSQYRYPVITEQIDKILKDAPRKFRNHPYVREYIDIAQKNMVLLREQSDDSELYPLQVKQQ